MPELRFVTHDRRDWRSLDSIAASQFVLTWLSWQIVRRLRQPPQEGVQDLWGATAHWKLEVADVFWSISPPVYIYVIASRVVFGTQSSQLRRWEGLVYHFSLNKSLMGLTQSCGKNSDWFVTITQSCGKALIGWSQIRKSGDRIFDLSELCHRFE